MARQMKDSGIAWIGEIPETWSTDRLQWHLDEVNVSNSPVQSENILSLTIEAGVIPYEEKGNQGNKSKENYEEYKLAYPDTLVVNSMNVIIGAVGISKYFGCVSPVYYVFRAATGTDLRYVYYLFTNVGFQKEMRKHAKGILEIRLRISSGDMQKLSVPNPEYEEQRRIADFLDRHCAEIDAVMERTKATIEEYKKLKQAVITEAVTKGVRGPRKMKDSGIEWIGEIPEGWDMVKITRILDYDVPYPIGDGDHGLISPDDYQDDGIPYLRVQNLGWGTQLNLDGLVYISAETNERVKNSTLHPNDVLFAKTGATIGKTGIVPENMPMANTTSHVGKITVAPRYSAMWVFYVLSSHVGYRQFWQIAQQKTTRPELAIAEIKAICLPMPSDRAEQDEIVEYLKVRCAELEKMISSKETLLTELETNKKSVIYEYVTGKKQV